MDRKYQRDVNCVSDSDRSIRTRALKKLDDALFGSRSIDFDDPGARNAFLTNGFLVPLVKRIGDPVEKNRSLAVGILKKFLENDKAGTATDASFQLSPELVDALAREVFQALELRLCETPFPEESEEIRLQMMELLYLLICHPNAKVAVTKDFARVARIVSKACADNNPDNKRQCCLCCVGLCQGFENLVRMSCESLLVPVIINMKHQRAKVRQSALQALRYLVCICWSSANFDELMSTQVIPALRLLNHDNSAAVRIECIAVISEWLVQITKPEYKKEFLPILLFGLADQAIDIQNLALATIEKIGATVQSDTSDAETICQLPEPFTGRPSAGSRELVSEMMDGILPGILKDASDWTAQGRFRAVALLRCILVFVEKDIQRHVESILICLFSTCRDDETTIRDISLDCGRLLGCYVSTDTLFGVLLPTAIGLKLDATGADSAPIQKVGAMAILTGAIYGLPSDSSLEMYLDKVAALVSLPSLCDDPSVQLQVLQCVQAVIDRAVREHEVQNDFHMSPVTVSRLLIALFVLATNGKSEDEEMANHSIFELAACCRFLKDGSPDVQKLSESCAAVLMQVCLSVDSVTINSQFVMGTATTAFGVVDVANACVQWNRYEPYRRVFDSLVRRAGLSGLHATNQLSTTVNVLLATCSQECDAELRLGMLSLLEEMTSQSDIQLLEPYLSKLIQNMLVPNVVWRVGRVPSTVRKVSMFCLASCISSSQVNWLFGVFPEMLPIIKGGLDDMEADTRRFATNFFNKVFTLFEVNNLQLDHFIVSGIYHDLIKRLDDADDRVRIAGCGAVVALCKIAPVNVLSGTASGYIADACFIHLDDPNEQVQQAAFEVLGSMIQRRIDVQSISAKSRAERGRHRSPDWCDRVTALCQV